METNNRTKGTWYVNDNGVLPNRRIMCDDGIQKTHVADCFAMASGLPNEVAEANAAYICKAVNNHDALLSALIRSKDWFELNYKRLKIPLEGTGAPACFAEIIAAIEAAK